jgi:hypothetical protein
MFGFQFLAPPEDYCQCPYDHHLHWAEDGLRSPQEFAILAGQYPFLDRAYQCHCLVRVHSALGYDTDNRLKEPLDHLHLVGAPKQDNARQGSAVDALLDHQWQAASGRPLPQNEE